MRKANFHTQISRVSQQSPWRSKSTKPSWQQSSEYPSDVDCVHPPVTLVFDRSLIPQTPFTIPCKKVRALNLPWQHKVNKNNEASISAPAKHGSICKRRFDWSSVDIIFPAIGRSLISALINFAL